MTPEELRALADSATPGPWEHIPAVYDAAQVARGAPVADERLACLAPYLARLCAEWIDAFREILDVTSGYTRPMSDAERLALIERTATAALAKPSEQEAR